MRYKVWTGVTLSRLMSSWQKRLSGATDGSLWCCCQHTEICHFHTTSTLSQMPTSHFVSLSTACSIMQTLPPCKIAKGPYRARCPRIRSPKDGSRDELQKLHLLTHAVNSIKTWAPHTVERRMIWFPSAGCSNKNSLFPISLCPQMPGVI